MPNIKTIIKYSLNGKLQLPHPNIDELADHYIEGPYRITIPQEETGQAIDLDNKGTIKKILLRTDNGVQDLAALINGAQTLTITPVILLGEGVTSLEVANSSTENDWDLWVTVIYI
jgi:hypothetical protein